MRLSIYLYEDSCYTTLQSIAPSKNIISGDNWCMKIIAFHPWLPLDSIIQNQITKQRRNRKSSTSNFHLSLCMKRKVPKLTKSKLTLKDLYLLFPWLLNNALAWKEGVVILQKYQTQIQKANKILLLLLLVICKN